MRNRIADLAGIAASPDNAELLSVEDVAHVLGVSQREALKLTQGEDFPEPSTHLHRGMANERLPQPQPVWDRGDVERWAKEGISTQRHGEAHGS
jgi:predicted DNA-binding transcriptional regulator AlpA